MRENESTDHSHAGGNDEPTVPTSDTKHEGSDQIKERWEAGEDAHKKALQPDHLSRFESFMHKHFPDAKPHDRWQLVFTFVIAISTFFYTIFAGWTLYEIHSGSTDTHALAEAASKQASHTETIAGAAQDQVDAADNISDAADSFSNSADEIREETTRAVEQLKRTADDSEKAISQASRNAQESLRISQRPYVTVDSVKFDPAVQSTDVKAIVKVDLHNSGRSPALKYTYDWEMFADGVKAQAVPTDFPGEAIIASDRTVTTGLIIAFSATGAKAVTDGGATLILKGVVHYTDVFKDAHTTTVCGVWDSKEKLWKFCPGNDAQ